MARIQGTDGCTELTCLHHGEANMKQVKALKNEPTTNLEKVTKSRMQFRGKRWTRILDTEGQGF